MAISFSGLVSGLDTSSWVEALVSVKQQKVTSLKTELQGYQTTKNTLTDTRSTVSSLRTAIEKLTDAKFGGTFDVFSQNSVKSSNEDVVSATVGTSARRQNYNVTVEQLATYTKATSRDAASAVADDTTSLKNLGVTAGNLTAYVNGHKNTVKITEDDTLGDLKSKLAEFGIKTEIDESGVLRFSAQNEGDDIHVGSTTDSTNLASIVGLERQEDGSYASTNSLYKATIATKLTSEDSGFNQRIKAGTFTIGNAVFTIDDNTTLSSLISQINSSDEAQANAFWDDATGKLIITSTKEGASFINIEAGTSNFTDVMGFTNSTWDEEGNVLASRMYTDTQELGKNALFTVNGTSMISTSNTVTSDVSRMDGVTLKLNRVTTDEDGTTSISVTQDTSSLKDAVNGFISAYNNVMTKIDTVTAQGAELHGETSLTSLKRSIRDIAMGKNDAATGAYKMLADLGITTSGADSDLSADTTSLKLDEEKFMKALEENPDSVRELLSDEHGIFAMMEDTVEQSLKSVSGFFDVRTSTLDSNIKRANEKITAKNKSIETYKSQLEAKFQAMEKMIASMQQNYQSFLTK